MNFRFNTAPVLTANTTLSSAIEVYRVGGATPLTLTLPEFDDLDCKNDTSFWILKTAVDPCIIAPFTGDGTTIEGNPDFTMTQQGQVIYVKLIEADWKIVYNSLTSSVVPYYSQFMLVRQSSDIVTGVQSYFASFHEDFDFWNVESIHVANVALGGRGGWSFRVLQNTVVVATINVDETDLCKTFSLNLENRICDVWEIQITGVSSPAPKGLDVTWKLVP